MSCIQFFFAIRTDFWHQMAFPAFPAFEVHPNYEALRSLFTAKVHENSLTSLETAFAQLPVESR